MPALQNLNSGPPKNPGHRPRIRKFRDACREFGCRPGLGLGLVLALSLTTSCGTRDSESIELTGKTMGTTYTLRAVNNGLNSEALNTLANAVEEELAEIDREMSTWREDSLITQLNADATQEWFPLPERLFEVLGRAMAIHQTTDGALDVTLLPLARAWGFQGEQPPSRPEEALLESLLRHTGMNLLELNPEKQAIRKRDTKMQLDVSSLAKGYGADRLANLLQAAELQDFLVEIGGELVARGERPGGGPWRIALDRPGDEATIIEIAGGAVASSGDYRNYFEENGERYAHVLDPVTGAPPLNGVAAVTVLAEDGITADALATAFMVLEPDQSLVLAKSLKAEISILIRTNNGSYQQLNTPGFPAPVMNLSISPAAN